MTAPVSATSLLESYRNGSILPSDALRERLEHVESHNRRLLALREVHEDLARVRAQTLEKGGERNLPLWGVPVAIKDNVAQSGMPNRAGRRDSAGDPAKADAVIVRRLLQAGAVVIGRANMDELAYGVTGSNPHTGQVRNARNDTLHPGGSSAGSASAVAAGMVPLAVGTDTAGSVRIPAALCGLVGMRPTHGTVPAEGIAPLCPSLDTAGPIATTVRDVALMLSVMTGRTEFATVPYQHAAYLKSVKVAAIEGSFAVDVSDGVKARFESATGKLKGIVGSVERMMIQELARAARASGPIIGSEASFVWQKEFDAHPAWFGEEVASHLSKGSAIKAVRYLQARDECALVVNAIDAVLETWDILALPTTATVATPAGAPGPQLRFLGLTVPFSLGGYPAITVPMGDVEGAPTGLQLVAKRGADSLVLAAAAAFEAAS